VFERAPDYFRFSYLYAQGGGGGEHDERVAVREELGGSAETLTERRNGWCLRRFPRDRIRKRLRKGNIEGIKECRDSRP
jgi:hypothetical protein